MTNVKAVAGAALAVAALSSATLGCANAAGAAPSGGSSAATTVEQLQSQGYAVQLNGIPNGPLSQCIATGIHGMSDSNIDSEGRRIDPSKFSTIYVDISCSSTS